MPSMRRSGPDGSDVIDGLAPIEPCERCGAPSPLDWPRCGGCGVQRLFDRDGTFVRVADPAGVLRRTTALLVDLLLIAVPAALTYLLPDRVADPSPAAGGEEALLSAIVLAGLLYLVVAPGASGRTLGKRLLGVHVIDDSGRPLGHPRAAIREGVGKVLEVSALVFCGGVGYAAATADGVRGGALAAAWLLAALPGLALGLAAFDPRRRSLHDHLAATLCVLGPPVSGTGSAAAPPAAAPPAPAPAA
jgi:uncharacterized RDD family membrane protein YckC